MFVPLRRLTRRQALKLGAAAAALGTLKPGASALGAPRPEAFTLALDEHGATAAAAGWRTTRIFDAPRRFDLIGLGWRRPAHLHAEVRARRHGGPWSRWAPLQATGDHGPDGSAPPAGTDPAWTGDADQFQLRLRGSARGLHARFVRSGPAARAAQRRLRAVASRQIPGAPAMFTRAQWGGDTIIPRNAPSLGQVQLAFVHHTVNANDYGPGDSAGIVLGIAKYHRDYNGWSDIGYNFLVDQYGQIFEGRAGGIDKAIVGAQTQGFNSVSTGVASLGTFTAVPLAVAGIEALGRIIGWKLALHGVPAQGAVTVTSLGGASNRWAAGTPVTLQRVSGHRDGGATTCPGDGLYAQLPAIRARAAGAAGPTAGVTVRALNTKLLGVRTASLSGVLRFPDGSSPLNAGIEILYTAATGGVAAPIARAACTADGSWSTTVELAATGTIRARFPGDAARAAMESTPLTIRLIPRISLALSSRRFRRRRRITASGTISPQPAGAATMQLDRKVRGRYKRRWRRTLAVTGTRYGRSLRPTRRGLYRLTVRSGGASTRTYFRVR